MDDDSLGKKFRRLLSVAVSEAHDDVVGKEALEFVEEAMDAVTDRHLAAQDEVFGKGGDPLSTSPWAKMKFEDI